MDLIDKKILTILQKDVTIPLSDISKRVGISKTPCWNRIKKMEEDKVILNKIALLDNNKINLPITVFLLISVSSHSQDWIKKFSMTVDKYDEITEVYRLTGSSSDYMLRVVAHSIEDYDKFQQKIINEIEFSKMSSNISLKEMKKNHSFPLDYI